MLAKIGRKKARTPFRTGLRRVAGPRTNRRRISDGTNPRPQKNASHAPAKRSALRYRHERCVRRNVWGRVNTMGGRDFSRANIVKFGEDAKLCVCIERQYGRCDEAR